MKNASDSSSFHFSVLFTHTDVVNVLNNDFAQLVADEPLGKDFWLDMLGTCLAQFTVAHIVPRNLWEAVGQWAFALAIRKKYLLADKVEIGYYVRNEKLLARSRRGPKAAGDLDTDDEE